jgi:Gpi18-like mannosyltransferase
MGGFICVLTYRLGEKIFGRKAGIVAVYGPLIFFDGELLAASWGAFWSVALVLLVLKASRNINTKTCFVLGICGALSTITRPNFLLFAIAGYIWMAFTWMQSHVDTKRFLLSSIAVGIGFGFVAVPVAFQNYHITHHFSFLPRSGDINMYIGNNSDFEAKKYKAWSNVERD